MSVFISTIGETCEFSRGLTYKKSDEVDISNNRVLRANNITLETGEINFSEIKYISDEIDIPLPKKVKKGSLLICTASGSKKHLGKIAFIEDDIDFAFGGFMGMLTPKESLHPKYLYWITQSYKYKEFILGLNDGANINNLKFSQLAQFEVPLFSINEQKRIVTILDLAFADIEKARANAEQNLKNARELFESYLQQVFSQHGDGWVEKKLKDAVDSVSTGPFGSMLHKSDYIEGGVPLVNPINIVGEKIVPNDSKTVTNETVERLKTYVLSSGDVVIARRGEIGRCAVVNEHQNGWVCGTGCFYIKPSTTLNSYFLTHLLRSPKYRERLEKTSTGATMKNLSNMSLKQLTISFPVCIEEQEKVLNLIHTLNNKVKDVENIYIKKTECLDELKKSILQKAFTGKLTKEVAT